MKVLIIAQKIYENDDILGFFCGWLNNLAKKIDKIYVVALEKRNVDLAKNIELYSLGKENGSNRLNRFLKFNQILFGLCPNKKIDIIFIHMCPEYALLAFPYAKLKNIPIVMWYAHGNVNIFLRMASILVDKVISSSKDGYRINSEKLIIVGQGIDINKFNPPSPKGFGGLSTETLVKADKTQNNGKKIILSVGRISPIKNYEMMIKAANILVNQKGIRDLKFQIVGGLPIKSQNGYLDFLKNIVSEYKLQDYVQFVGPIPYTQIQNYYQNCDLFISTSNTGSLDKAVLEAMACGKAVLACNEAFNILLKNYSHILMFDKNNTNSLVEKIIYILDMDAKDIDNLTCDLREIVVRNHNLSKLVDNILTVFKDTINSK